MCGEVQTLRAHPVWDSLCPVVFGALNFFYTRRTQAGQTHTHLHAHSGLSIQCAASVCGGRQNRCTPVTHRSSGADSPTQTLLHFDGLEDGETSAVWISVSVLRCFSVLCYYATCSSLADMSESRPKKIEGIVPNVCRRHLELCPECVFFSHRSKL